MSSKGFAYYWVALIFIILFVMIEGPIFQRDYKNAFFLCGGFLSIVLFGFKKINGLLTCSVLFFGLMAIFNQHHFLAYTPFIQMVYLFTGIGVLLQFYDKWDDKVEDILFKSLGAFCLIQCIWIILNGVGIFPYTYLYNYQLSGYGGLKELPVIGSLGHHMITGSFISITLPFMMRISPFLIIPFLAAVYMLPSGIPVVALALMVFSMGAVRFFRSLYFWIFIILGGLLGYILLEPYGVFYPSERLKTWAYSLEVLWSSGKQILGLGMGHFKDFFYQIFQNKFVEMQRHPHNEFIYIFYSFGMIGGIIFLWWYFWALFQFNLCKYAWLSMVALFVPLMFSFPLHTSSTAIVAIISLASILSKRDNKAIKGLL